ncbi:hypothetical protein RR46_07029 [Papilio xuthus]|uniref:Uncharacterized protein n=1 Tax=Papilio xuthus TaxID=66420 RepID=A0A194Q504_PAPXU|nr:hypothetical protein RR46_07029 [Papilio xuthus]
MYKKNLKTQEHTEKRFDDKNKPRDVEIVLRKINRNNRFESTNLRIPRILHDRGDAKNTKVDAKFKYDSSKVNRATEANAKCIKTETISYRNNSFRKINGSNKIIPNKDVSNDSKLKLTNIKTENKEKVVEDKKVLEKEPQIQKTLVKNDRIGTEKSKVSDEKKPKIKEIITIPYLPLDDSVTQITDEEISEPIKPIIKDTTKSTPKTLSPKTVTFKDQRLKSAKKTENKDNKMKNISNIKMKNNKTKTPTTTKGLRRRKRFSASPAKCVINEFPPTEVVKWEPSCLTSQTQPYYEAWVDTTLTAFSKYSEHEKSIMEKDLLKALQHLKRPVSPELIYERFKDERYTGRIRIRRK